jgi:flagellar motility protein MotE (MotC chaperone)
VEQAAAPEEDYEVLAKILGNMKAAESSQILLHLSDQQAEGVLRRINPRLAAQILAKIPPDRAGALSQRLLVPRGENP